MQDGYATIRAFAQASFVEKKSEFIGFITPCAIEETAVGFIHKIRAEHRKAAHHVYAYILREGNITRCSDDGEPQGTAGVPVLEVLRKEGLSDVCCVVTRYFGGILLGAGGLVRAYSHAAKIAVEAAEKMLMRPAFPLEITADYNLYGKIANTLPEFEVKITDTVFETGVTVKLLAQKSLADKLTARLVELTNGRVNIARGEETYADFAKPN